MENKNLQEFIADLQSKSLNSENDTRAVLSVTGSAADAESFNGYNYKELALSNKATGYLDLNKGNLVIEIGSVNTEEFVLPFTIALIHKSNNASGKLGEGWRLSLNKQLKLAENDTDKTTKYTYKDEKGDTYTFDEKYYIFENGAKTFLSKEKITIDLNANLTYNNKPVYKRQFCKGYTLIPAINDFVNSELIEQRQSEQVELEDYIRQIEPSLKSYVIINSANGGKIRELAGLNKNAYDQFISGVESNAGAILVTKRQSFKLRELYNKLAVESDSALIQAQIDEIISRAQDNLPVIKEEFKKYFGKKAELELLLKQIPVNYLRDENGVINGFNKNGDLVLMADSYGNYFSIEYNSKNLIVGIYDNNKKVVNFEYKNDLLQSVTDKRGRQVKYGYDSSDRLTTVTYPDGQTCAITYTSNHRIATLTDGYGNRSEFTYSGTKLSGLTAKNTLTNNTVSTLTAEYTDNSVKLTSDKGESEEYQFNAENKLLKLVTSDERNYIKTRQYSYANNNKTVTCMEDENVSSYYVRDIKEYDELDLLTTYTVDWHNVSYNAREKTVSKYSYDSDNKLVSKKTKQYIETDSDPGEDGTIENFEYNHVENYSYDTNGNLTLTESYTEEEKQTAGVNFVERVYNDDGNMIKCIRWNSLDSSTKFYEECERDKDGTVRYGQDETGAYSTLYEYVSGTNVINSVTYSNGGKIAYGRNPHNNQITAVTQSTAEGEANTTNIVYENGLPVKVTSGNTTLEYKYDGKGRKTEVKLNGTTQTTYAYDDSRSNASGTYNFGGQSVTYATGGSGVKISKTVQGKSGSSALQLTEYTKINDNTVIRQTDYNATGSVRRIIDNTRAGRIGRTTYDYDDYGNLTRITSLNSDNTAEILREERSYTMRGELSSKIFRGEVKQVYYYAYRENSTCELASVVIDGYSFTPLTDVYGRNTGKEIYNTTNRIAGEYITYRKVGDHATNMPATVWFANGSEIKDSIKYKYDSCGNICEITQNGHTEIRYTYDALNRLIREDNKPLNKTVIYSYDNAGNITQRCKYDYTEYSVVPHNGGNNHYKYEYNGDKLVSYNGEACEYNNIGNPTKYRGKVCEWQYGTQLTKYGTTEFKYDCFGRRVKKINGNTEDKYTYDNDGRLIQQKIGPKDNEVEQDNQYTQFIYDASGLAGVCFKRETYFYRKDAQGNIIAILDKNGKVVVKYDYDAWGNHKSYFLNEIGIFEDADKISSSQSSNINLEFKKYYELAKQNPFRYRGYYYDTETKLYYLQTRYYDPEVGRFISQDSIEYADPEAINGLNLYAYCGNNPVMYVDPTGTKLKWWHKLLIGIAFIAVGAVVTALTAGAGTGFFAALGSALLSSAIQVGISTAISAGIGLVVGGITTGTWQGALEGLFNGAVDGFMWGGIFAGGAQIISGGFKIAANLGVATGRNGGIQLTRNLKILSPNNVKFYENGGTLLKIGKNFRIDVGAKTMLHLHMLGAEHIPIGTILASFFGSYNSLWQK